MNKAIKQPPLVSVIIPCFNHAAFLPQAVASVLEQDYSAVEIIVVNDGSTDNTDDVAKSFEKVVYVNQQNKGLSAARNAGIKKAAGAYMLFLDADDVLMPGAISYQVKQMEENKEAAFISGGHIKVDETLATIEEVSIEIIKDHYINLLQGNYIGMHAAVLYRSTLFKEFLFDETLKAAEDYDLYLNIAAKYSVLHHTKNMALYRQHRNNMSGNLAFMLEHVLIVLARQKSNLHSAAQKAAYKKGVNIWKDYYCGKIAEMLSNKQLAKKLPFKKEFKATLWKYKPSLYIRVLLH